MFVYSVFFGLLYKLIGNIGAITAIITGIVCSIILIIKRHKGDKIKTLAYGVITAISIWFIIAISIGIIMVSFLVNNT